MKDRTIIELCCLNIILTVMTPPGAGQSALWPGKPKSGWLYVVDSNKNKATSKILVVDPERGTLAASFAVGRQPDIAISPDGARLYVTSISGPDDNHQLGLLQIVSTDTGIVFKQISHSDNWEHTVPFYHSNMRSHETDGSCLS